MRKLNTVVLFINISALNTSNNIFRAKHCWVFLKWPCSPKRHSVLMCFGMVPLWNIASWFVRTLTGLLAHGSYWRFSDFLSVWKPARRAMSFSSTVSPKNILDCTSHDNTEDINSIFNVTFHKFITNWTTRNQRWVAFSWLSVKQLRDLNSDNYTCNDMYFSKNVHLHHSNWL